MRIGVVNWGCALPSDTFFGGYSAKMLSLEKWRYCTPYYADIISDNQIDFHYRTAEEYDVELEYAIDAKVDYFAYVWHTDDKNPTPTSVTLPHAHTLDYPRKLHQQSRFSEKIKLCAILLRGHPYTEADYMNLAEAMKAAYYEKADNRPIVYLFGGYATELIDALKSFPQKYGTENPYIVFMNNGAESPDGDYSKVDAVSAYACDCSGIEKYSQLIDAVLNENLARKKYGVSIVPLFSVGWNPTPRIETPVPWISYPDTTYAHNPTPDEIKDGATRFAAWVKENSEYTKTNHILTFAWNEFEEGAFICPTLNSDGSINEDRISAFADVAKIFKDITFKER